MKHTVEVYQGKSNNHYDSRSFNDLRRKDKESRFERKASAQFKLKRESLRWIDTDDLDSDE